MVRALKYLSWICATLLCLSGMARDVSTYKIGDVAQEDIKATVPFDVVDAVATDSLKSSRAMDVPAIYRNDTEMTNSIVKKYLKAFATAHSNFCAAVTAAYGQAAMDQNTLASPDFGYFVTAYNVENKSFPVTPELADDWARGDPGTEFQDKWLGILLQSMSHHVRPDKLPAQFVVHHNIRLVELRSMEQPMDLTGAERHGTVIDVTNIPTITHLRMLFRSQFTQEELPLARVLANFIQPDCLPDVALTDEARDIAVRQIVVADHFDAGQTIVAHGKTVTPQLKAALDAYSEKLIPGALNQQIAAEHAQAVEAQQLAEEERQRAQLAQEQSQKDQTAAREAQEQQQLAQLQREEAQNRAQQAHAEAMAAQETALNAQILAMKTRERNEWLVGGLALAFAIVLVAVWRLMRQQPRQEIALPVAIPSRLQKMDKPQIPMPPELAPYLAETLKEAVVQGLAAQRAELLEAQRMASVEIAELVQRLDLLQAPMQERLRAYQDRIVELQKDLAQRTEENRELLKMKIEMMRRQLENERGRQAEHGPARVKLN